MKCLLIASESAEILFHWTDQEFQQNVQEKYSSSQEEGEGLPAFEDIISTLFAPIIISCGTMVYRQGDSYTSFTTENNHIYALCQFDECLYIAVNGDGEEKEDDLRRKLYVLRKITEVMFGMVTLSGSLLRKELRPQDTEQRVRLWKHLQSLVETYNYLRESDQSFLVEAVERLIHPTLCEQCIEFLERRLVQQINSSSLVERAGEEVLHTFILVHTKLLAFYSSRTASTLNTSDLLTLIIMAQNMYPSNVELDEPSPEVQPPISYSKIIYNYLESTSGSGPESFYTPEPSPSSRDSSSSEDSLHTLDIGPPDPSTPRRVFLELKDGQLPMVPHSMYCLPLWPGITLVLLTKVPNIQITRSVYSFLEDFTKLEKCLNEGQAGSGAARGQLNMHNTRSKLDKFIRDLGPSELQVTLFRAHKTNFYISFEIILCLFFYYSLIPLCKSMKTRLCSLYRQRFLTDTGSSDGPRCLSPALQERAQTMVQEKLMDWKDFLLVKSKRNITMVSYPLQKEEFPGLVHFIWVDRSSGQIIAPSLNITERTTSELGKGPVARYIKSKVWGLVRTTRQYLRKGYSTVTLRDGDFYFCYFLWFENENGYKLEAGDIPILPDDSPPIGMLGYDYYRKLLRYYGKNHQGEAVKCYELLTVHLGVIPTEIILQHCRQLASKLWEPSRNPLL
uniref:HPS1 biogenesis of lysosomal organelles complex 3 subunit 1 n=1 Tax=Oryzias sinensis TaxID=183150 RepID=A0A8C7XF36_9TELE